MNNCSDSKTNASELQEFIISSKSTAINNLYETSISLRF